MLKLDDPQETHDTTTAATAAERPTPPREELVAPRHVARRPRRWVVALAATSAFAGVATVAFLAQPDREGNTTAVPDASFDQAETNRLTALRDLTDQPPPDNSHDQAETNRLAALRDLTNQPPPDNSHDQAETNRLAALRDVRPTP